MCTGGRLKKFQGHRGQEHKSWRATNQKELGNQRNDDFSWGARARGEGHTCGCTLHTHMRERETTCIQTVESTHDGLFIRLKVVKTKYQVKSGILNYRKPVIT